MSIGAVSFNRYIHICHNEMYSKIFTRTSSLCMCVGLWVVCFLAEMSCFVGWGDHSYDHKTLSCVWDRTADFSYTIFFSVAGVAFPILLISICYARIYLFVKASKQRVAAMQESRREQMKDFSTAVQRQESMRLARTLFIIFAVFAACWTPYAIIVVADRYDTYPMEIHIFSILMAHTNSSLNSILYGLTNIQFRLAYLQIFRLVGSLCFGKRFSTEVSQLPQSRATHNDKPGITKTISTVMIPSLKPRGPFEVHTHRV